MPRKQPSLPTPTYWVEKTPDGIPPSGALLLIRGFRNFEDEEETSLFITLGIYSDRLQIFLDETDTAIEQGATVTHYHLVHHPDGTLFQL